MSPDKQTGVVDQQSLKVHGTRNLRVVDASVFPMQPTGTIQGIVYAVAERGADLIKHDLFAAWEKEKEKNENEKKKKGSTSREEL